MDIRSSIWVLRFVMDEAERVTLATYFHFIVAALAIITFHSYSTAVLANTTNTTITAITLIKINIVFSILISQLPVEGSIEHVTINNQFFFVVSFRTFFQFWIFNLVSALCIEFCM